MLLNFKGRGASTPKFFGTPTYAYVTEHTVSNQILHVDQTIGNLSVANPGLLNGDAAPKAL